MDSEFELRRDVVEVCRRMYVRHLLAGVDGNVSVRWGRDKLICTPSGTNKGYLSPEDLVVVDIKSGRVVRKGKRDRSLGASSEVDMHLTAYRCRPEIRAVVHGHPPIAVARTIAGRAVVVAAIPEAVVYLGPVPTAPYATPGTDAVGASIEALISDPGVSALMLDRHGSLTVGADVFDAFNRLDALEHTARLLCAAEALGPVSPLPALEIDTLMRLVSLED